MSTDLSSLNAGQTLSCTINKVPQNKAAVDTITRLMRRDPEAKRALKHAQKLRGQRMNVYVRGNRWWSSREKAARVVRCTEGASWSMPFTFDVGDDLKSVEQYLKIDAQ